MVSASAGGGSSQPPTASGATAVQIVNKRAGVRRIVEHLGSAHDEAELAVLMHLAWERLNVGQDELDLGLDAVAAGARARVVASSSQVLWDVLVDAYQRSGSPSWTTRRS